MNLIPKWRANLLPSTIALLLAILISAPFSLIAQNLQSIIGTILDGRTNSPLPDVRKSTGNGAKTGPNGEFSIKAKRGDVLVFSFAGYETQQVTVQNQSTINYTLKRKYF